MEELYGFYFTKDKIIEINYEYQFTQNPRTFYDNLFTIYTWNNYYDSPDENIPFDDFFYNFDKDKYIYKLINIGKGYLEINNNQKININESKGIAFISKEDLKKAYNCKYITKKIIKKAFDILDEEIKIYNDYISGLVFYGNSYSLFGEFIDSCSGFFGIDFDKNGFYENFGKPKQEFYEKFELEMISKYIYDDNYDERYLLYFDHLKEKYEINTKDSMIEFHFNENIEFFYEKDLIEELKMFFNKNFDMFSKDINEFIENNLMSE